MGDSLMGLESLEQVLNLRESLLNRTNEKLESG
jgi:hypothetical protein